MPDTEQQPADVMRDARHVMARAGEAIVDQERSIGVLKEALKACRAKFVEYGLLHDAKGTEEGRQKALRNREMVDMIDEAVNRADRPHGVTVMRVDDAKA